LELVNLLLADIDRTTENLQKKNISYNKVVVSFI